MTSPSPSEIQVPAVQRLEKRWQFLAAAQGLSAARGAVVVQGLQRAEPESPHIGVGFTATRKIGGAVVRNRAKRRMREAARVVIPELGRPGWDYVLVARQGAPTRPWTRLLDDVKSALISLAAGGDAPRPYRAGKRTQNTKSGPVNKSRP